MATGRWPNAYRVTLPALSAAPAPRSRPSAAAAPRDPLPPATPPPHRLPDLRPVVAGQLGGRGARLDQRDPDVPLGHLLAQRLAEGTDRVLGRVVDAAAVPGDPARDRAD